MTDELTDAERAEWLRTKLFFQFDDVRRRNEIADRLEHLAAENAVLNSRLAELQGRYFAAVTNNEALMAERNKLAAENAASEEVIETLTQERDAWAEELAALTYQNRKLREALETIVECDTAAVKELEALGIKADTSLVALARKALGEEK